MPHEVTLSEPVPTYTFTCYGSHEAKRLGLIDTYTNEGSHAAVSTQFCQTEGKLLAEFIKHIPDAILVISDRNKITVYRPKLKVLEIPEDEE